MPLCLPLLPASTTAATAAGSSIHLAASRQHSGEPFGAVSVAPASPCCEHIHLQPGDHAIIGRCATPGCAEQRRQSSCSAGALEGCQHVLRKPDLHHSAVPGCTRQRLTMLLWSGGHRHRRDDAGGNRASIACIRWSSGGLRTHPPQPGNRQNATPAVFERPVLSPKS